MLLFCTVKLIYFRTSSFSGRVQNTPKNYIINFGDRLLFMIPWFVKKRKKKKQTRTLYFSAYLNEQCNVKTDSSCMFSVQCGGDDIYSL